MDVASLIRIAVLISMMLLVFALGVRAGPGDAAYLFRKPALLVRSLLAMNVIMPLVAIWLVYALDLKPAVKVALVALSVSPVPPFLPGKQLKLVSHEGYVYGLLVASALLAVLLVPIATGLLAAAVERPPNVSAFAILRIVALTVLLPLGAGLAVRHWWGGSTERLVRVTTVAGTVLLIVAFIPVLVAQWGGIRSLIGDGTLVAIVVFTAVGLLIGHFMAGNDPENKTVLGLATATRHPAVALAIAAALFPEQKLAPAAVLLSLVVGALASAPYTSWRKRVHEAELLRPGGGHPRRSS